MDRYDTIYDEVSWGWPMPKALLFFTRRNTIAKASASQSHATLSKQVVGAYRKRMRIEEAFRDSTRILFGMGLERARNVPSCVFQGLANLVRKGEFDCGEDDLVVIKKRWPSPSGRSLKFKK